MHFSRPAFTRVGAAALAALTVAACSSSNGATPASTVPVTAAPATTAPATTSTTTAASTTSSSAAATTTTAAPAEPVMPLTGLPITDAAAAAHPAVVVKVGNYDDHPQSGANAADIVYEEIINASISRFAMIFQSQPFPSVGPIRSGRRQDVDLFSSYNRPVFAWAGGNATVTGEVNNSDLVNFSETYCKGSCFRSNSAKAPFNLFFNVAKVWDVVGASYGPPPQQFKYRAPGVGPAGSASPGVALKMDNYDVDWTWDGTNGVYDRKQNGRPDTEAGSGEQVTTNNIVVLSMVYLPGISGSPDAQSIGKGEAFVFTRGNYIHGTWSRADRTQPFTLTADDGTPIELTPGRTFVELPREGSTTPK